jgi:integrase
VYIRQKTKKLIMLPLQEKAIEIVNRYRSSQRKYIFPVLDNRERTPRQIRNRIYDVLDNVNGYLADIGNELGIELKISSYVARHSYATVLKRSGVSTSVISESLGHSSERVTQIYLDSFENRQLNDAMKNLL